MDLKNIKIIIDKNKNKLPISYSDLIFKNKDTYIENSNRNKRDLGYINFYKPIVRF